MKEIMRDHADKTWLKPESLEAKRQVAHALLNQLGINRASTHCNHVYTDSSGKRHEVKS